MCNRELFLLSLLSSLLFSFFLSAAPVKAQTDPFYDLRQ